jgi:hypothetical protein
MASCSPLSAICGQLYVIRRWERSSKRRSSRHPWPDRRGNAGRSRGEHANRKYMNINIIQHEVNEGFTNPAPSTVQFQNVFKAGRNDHRKIPTLDTCCFCFLHRIKEFTHCSGRNPRDSVLPPIVFQANDPQ